MGGTCPPIPPGLTPLRLTSGLFGLQLCGYTARNATDLLQVVDFTGLMQVVNKLQQVCENQTSVVTTWYLQTCCKLLKQLQQTCWQLAADLLSSSRSKRCEHIQISAWWQQGNKTTVSLLQLACFWLCGNTNSGSLQMLNNTSRSTRTSAGNLGIQLFTVNGKVSGIIQSVSKHHLKSFW